MLKSKDIHIGDILEAKSKTDKLYLLIESIIDRTSELVWTKVLFIDEKVGVEFTLNTYMIWFSDESTEYSKVCNVFELEAKNEHKAV
jgi:hypothetical protein